MAETEPVVEASDALFVFLGMSVGYFDAFLLVLLGAGLAIYWFKFRENEDNEVDLGEKYKITPTSAPSKAVDDKSFIKKMKTSGRNVVVFFGSQTGTGEEFAGRLAKEAQRYGMKGMVADPEETNMAELIDLPDIDKSLAIFCLATYGEGDPTDNTQDFYDWLQEADEVDLSGLNYAVFSLGNKTYEHFNAMGIYVDKRLEELGATRVFENGMGDDDANIEEDFITWKDKFWPAVCEKFGLIASGEDVSMRQYRLVTHEDEPLAEDRVYTGEVARLLSYKNQRPPYDGKNPFMSRMTVKKELYKGTERSCMHIELDIADSRLRYDAGDHVAVYPVNDSALVNRLGDLLDVDLDQIFSLLNLDEDSSKKYPFPCPCSYKTALSYYLDITSNPRTHVLKELAEYATDEKEKELLKLIGGSTTEGKEKYHKWVANDNRNIVHILEDLPSCKPSLDHLCELLPRLQARYYSISSSSKVYPTSIHITAALVKYQTPTGRVNKGVATNWLAEIASKILEGDQKIEQNPLLPIFVRKSQFRLPIRPTTPVIMIGPGTGLAPFRGFIQERNLLKEEGKPVGETLLYFGCRKKAEDFLYEEELEQYIKNDVIKMHVAFSRDTSKKVYVQHLLLEHAKDIWRLIGQESAHLYVCGDAKQMARDVHEAIEKILREEGGMSESEAAFYVKRMEAQKRYSADVWS